MFEKILVCLDGSSAAEQILSYVIGVAICFHSDVVLLRVVSLPDLTIPVGVPGSPGIPVHTSGAIQRTTDEESQAADYLERIAGQLREKGLDVELMVLPGIAGETIINYAQENSFKLIAIATHGHGGLRRLAFGSTADFVLNHSALPVLMVRAGAKPV
jgi:nucleotide-binding universal stress UspA family protein